MKTKIPLHLANDNEMITHSGLYINPFAPHQSQIDINDIAHSLSLQPRWAGHLSTNISVARHSVNCYLEAKLQRLSLMERLQCLMHDAAEYIFMDIPTPIKRMFPEYKKAEERLMVEICCKFGIDYPFSPTVKRVDYSQLEFEWNNFMFDEKMMPENSYSIDKFDFLGCFQEITHLIKISSRGSN